MKSVLENKVVVLNRNWQAIHMTTAEEAVKQLCVDVATAMVVNSNTEFYPVTWAEWLTLPIRDCDTVIHTPHMAIRCPTVIIALNYAKVPKKRPKFNLRGIAARDGHRCQYTQQVLKPEDMSMDHIQPRSRGGANSPDNVVLAHREFNNKKGDRTPEELGLPRPKPKKMLSLPIGEFLTATHPDHELFLGHKT